MTIHGQTCFAGGKKEQFYTAHKRYEDIPAKKTTHTCTPNQAEKVPKCRRRRNPPKMPTSPRSGSNLTVKAIATSRTQVKVTAVEVCVKGSSNLTAMLVLLESLTPESESGN